MGKGGKYLKGKAAGAGKRRTLMVLLVLALVILGALGAGAVYVNSMLNLITRPTEVSHDLSDAELEAILGYVPEVDTSYVETAPMPKPTKPEEDGYGKTGRLVNIMVVGQQMRKGEESKLSDTMILCTVNKETKTLTLTSFLRDLYVKLPNFKGHICGQQRINVAYNLGWRWAGDLGGMEMLDQLIWENFGVEIDHNVEINFDSFVKVLDVIGGIEVELDADEVRYMNTGWQGTPFRVGNNALDGEAALIYARMRSANAGDNDFNRTRRQRTVVTKIVEKCRSMTLGQLNDMVKTILPMVITDMTNEDITTYILELLPLLKDLTIVSNQIPAEGTYWGDMVVIGGYDAGVLKCDIEENRALLMELAEGIPRETEPAE